MDFFNNFGKQTVTTTSALSVGKFQSLHIDRQISEGGFGFVYAVSDTKTGNKYALKQINV